MRIVMSFIYKGLRDLLDAAVRPCWHLERCGLLGGSLIESYRYLRCLCDVVPGLFFVMMFQSNHDASDHANRNPQVIVKSIHHLEAVSGCRTMHRFKQKAQWGNG